MEELVRVLQLKYTLGKVICYTLMDKDECFIISAAIELDIDRGGYQ